MVGAAVANPSTKIGESVLEYWVHFEPQDDGWSVWLFRYYSAVEFIGMTMPKESVPANYVA